MNRFWVIRDGRRDGPYSEDEVLGGYRAGSIAPADRLWTEGIAEPIPAAEVFAQLSGAAAPAQPAAPTLGIELEPLESIAAGRDAPSPYRPPASTVAQEQGFDATGAVRYAGFWVRFGAAFIDNFVLGLIGLVIGVALGVMQVVTGKLLVERWVEIAISVVLGWLYYALQESGAECATWGKRAFHLQVLQADGLNRISFLRATGRVLGRYLSILVLMIGYLMQPFNARKRALHDFVAGTVVVVESQYSRLLLGAIIALNVAFIVGAGVLLAVALPEYRNYTVRARVEAVVYQVLPATEAVGNYVASNGKAPSSLDEAGFDTRQPIDDVRTLDYDPKSGNITVTLDFDPVAGQSFLFVPERLRNEQIAWQCRGGTLPAHYLPKSCRR